MYPLNRTTVSPSFSSLSTLSYYTNSTNKTGTSKQTYGIFSPSPTSAGTISSGNPSNNSLFSVVFIASVAVATFLFLCLISVIFCCCCCCRRKRTANVTEKKRRPRGLRHSLKRTFSDGPLYAVTNLNGNHYTGITENRADEGQRTAQSSLKSNASRNKQGDDASEVGKTVTNDKSVYERYLSPIEGLPREKAVSKKRDQDSNYLEPVHGFPAPVKIVLGTNNNS